MLSPWGTGVAVCVCQETGASTRCASCAWRRCELHVCRSASATRVREQRRIRALVRNRRQTHWCAALPVQRCSVDGQQRCDVLNILYRHQHAHILAQCCIWVREYVPSGIFVRGVRHKYNISLHNLSAIHCSLRESVEFRLAQ